MVTKIIKFKIALTKLTEIFIFKKLEPDELNYIESDKPKQ